MTDTHFVFTIHNSLFTIHYLVAFKQEEHYGSTQVKITIPDNVLNTETGETSRHILEQFALEGYKSEQLTAAQVRRILGFSTRMEVDGFLKEHGVYLEYSKEDLERDAATSRELSSNLRGECS